MRATALFFKGKTRLELKKKEGRQIRGLGLTGLSF